MKNNNLFTISDLAKRKVCLLYDPEKHTKQQLIFLLSIAFPYDPVEPLGIVNALYCASITAGFWAIAFPATTNLPIQSLELFQAD